MRIFLAVTPASGSLPISRVVFSFDPTTVHSVTLLSCQIATELVLPFEPALFLSDEFWLPSEASVASILREDDRVTVRRPDPHPLIHLRASRIVEMERASSVLVKQPKQLQVTEKNPEVNVNNLEGAKPTKNIQEQQNYSYVGVKVPSGDSSTLEGLPSIVQRNGSRAIDNGEVNRNHKVRFEKLSNKEGYQVPSSSSNPLVISAINCSSSPATPCEPSADRKSWADSSSFSKTRRGNRKRGRNQVESDDTDSNEQNDTDNQQQQVQQEISHNQQVQNDSSKVISIVAKAAENCGIEQHPRRSPRINKEITNALPIKNVEIIILPKKETKIQEQPSIPKVYTGYASFTKRLSHNVPSGTSLAFKMLELSSERTPQVSRNIYIGTVLSQKGEELSMEIQRDNQTKNQSNDILDYGLNEKNTMSLTHSQMIEPVILSWGISKRSKPNQQKL